MSCVKARMSSSVRQIAGRSRCIVRVCVVGFGSAGIGGWP